ncbi:MAG: FAD-binding oxidoreductase [Confluentimicrobium sp.]|uniref:FAD-binding oxidoreductase n=1 Tax=Actibacterium sp. TaxID=1872125 RepID=UPI00050FF727|nr:FAD-binding oxidoreductase [Actibacterium sp.]KGB83485.1 FAD-linked oxidase [Rhodovulum sp. NI22]MBC58609.1 FAD-binding oxidoreductase [Actibacterium sp.]MDY6857838.1 FAD-binding oxidoreductase [Pseudomonadota bacterium]|tara:strand:- start:2138 stop:3541 length:1404 start_codon:yes stop_codon:yes gene_type:complete
MTPDVAAAKQALSHIEMDENPATIRSKSRDFFWYSPMLKARLDHVQADFVVNPKSEAEVIEVLKTCYAHDVPVTVRGAGTGNYGQAMPLAGGCVMHMKNFAQVKEIHPGRVIVEPGCIIKDLDAATRAHSGQEVRMMPSTANTATIGGFVAGGSGGVGSVKWGALRDLGNIIRLRVITMEAEPRVLEFRGEELARVSHAYGTNGIITEIEMPLAPAYDWVDMFVAFDSFPEAAQYASDLANEDGIVLKLASVYEAPMAHSYFQRVKEHVTETDTLVGLMVAPHSMDGFETFTARRPGARIIFRSDANDWPRDPGPVFEFGWNHTTLRALKFDPKITYLQVRYQFPKHLELVEKVRATFGAEVLQHLEVLREGGKVCFAGLPLVSYTSDERLEEIVRMHEDMGCMIFNPHRYTLEEGGRQSADARQLAFKREADPKGLLNPGKMITWDDPDWAYDRIYDYPGMLQVEP